MILVLLALAFAQPAPAEPDATEPDATEPDAAEPDAAEPDAAEPAPAQPEPVEPDEEIIVTGQFAIDKARDALIRGMERNGWRTIERRGELLFRGPAGWMGRSKFDPEMGSLDFRRPAVGFRSADYDQPPNGTPAGPTDPAGVARPTPQPSGAGFWLFPSKRKVDAVWSAVRQDTAGELAEYQRVVFATAAQVRIDEIPTRLDGLWSTGAPLEGSTPLPDVASRTQAILNFWSTRTDTPEGLRMSKAVEAWLNANSPVFSDAQREAAEAKRGDDRTLPR